MKWFCSVCWRSGESADITDAQGAHLREVSIDMEARRIPAGCDPKMSGSSFMEKYRAVYCAGSIHIGEMPAARKARFDKKLMPEFNFEGGE